jgi:hypothetical protein
MSRITLIGLLLSAAAVSDAALADQSGHDGYMVKTGQRQSDQPLLLKVQYHKHHRRHHRHHGHPG